MHLVTMESLRLRLLPRIFEDIVDDGILSFTLLLLGVFPLK